MGLSDYKLTGLHGTAQYAKAHLAGLLPLGFLVTLAFARPGGPTPMLWWALGAVVGLHLILRGAFELYHTEGRRTRLGEALARRTDAWYPALAFLIHQAFVVLLFASIWLTALDLGYPARWWVKGYVAALLALLPLGRLLHHLANDRRSGRLHQADDLLRCVNAILLTLLVADLAHWFLRPEHHPPWEGPPFQLFAVWVTASLVVAAHLMLLADRIARPRRH